MKNQNKYSIANELLNLIEANKRGLKLIFIDSSLNEILYRIIESKIPSELTKVYCSSDLIEFCNRILENKLQNKNFKILFVDKVNLLNEKCVNYLIHNYIILIKKEYNLSYLIKNIMNDSEDIKSIWAKLPNGEDLESYSMILKKLNKFAKKKHLYITLFVDDIDRIIFSEILKNKNDFGESKIFEIKSEAKSCSIRVSEY